MRTRAKWIFVAKATALGARVPQADRRESSASGTLCSILSHYSADWIDISMRQEEIV